MVVEDTQCRWVRRAGRTAPGEGPRTLIVMAPVDWSRAGQRRIWCFLLVGRCGAYCSRTTGTVPLLAAARIDSRMAGQTDGRPSLWSAVADAKR